MTTNASRTRHHVDFAARVTLKELADSSITVSTTEAAIHLGRLPGTPAGTDEIIPHGSIAGGIHIGAINGAGNNTYSPQRLAGPNEEPGEGDVVVLELPVSDLGTFEFGVDCDVIPADAEWLYATMVLEGDEEPAIAYAAWLTASRPS